MVPHVAASINWLRAILRRTPTCPPEPTPPPIIPDDPCPLVHPAAPLPSWVAADPVVQKYRALIGILPWQHFPERPSDRPWPGPSPDPRAPFVAAFLVKLHEDKRYMSDLRTYLIEHPALVYWLGFPRVADPTAPHGFHIGQTVPSRRQFGRVLRTLPNAALQFLLTATVDLLRATLPPDQQASFGDIIAGDTQALLAWVKENNPKQYIKEGRLTKTRQPVGDPDCKLGVKRRRNQAPPETDHDAPAPTKEAKPKIRLQVGVDIFWGYASGVVATASLTRPKSCWPSVPARSTNPTPATFTHSWRWSKPAWDGDPRLASGMRPTMPITSTTTLTKWGARRLCHSVMASAAMIANLTLMDARCVPPAYPCRAYFCTRIARRSYRTRRKNAVARCSTRP
jgi:hypothetical protein